jgi:hypothetical protein
MRIAQAAVGAPWTGLGTGDAPLLSFWYEAPHEKICHMVLYELVETGVL